MTEKIENAIIKAIAGFKINDKQYDISAIGAIDRTLNALVKEEPNLKYTINFSGYPDCTGGQAITTWCMPKDAELSNFFIEVIN